MLNKFILTLHQHLVGAFAVMAIDGCKIVKISIKMFAILADSLSDRLRKTVCIQNLTTRGTIGEHYICRGGNGL